MKLSIEELATIKRLNNSLNADRVFAHIEAIEQELTEAKQETLQKREEVRILMQDRSTLYENNLMLKENVSATNIGIAKKHAELIKSYGEIHKIKVAYEAEKEARVLLEATLERAMLDHQPVVLSPKQVIALECLRSDNFDNYTIIRFLTTHAFSQEQAPHFNELCDMDMNVLISALVNGYTVDLELPIVYQIADIVQEWWREPSLEDDALDHLALAGKIAEWTEKNYSKN